MIYQDDRYIKFQADHEKAEIIQAGGMPLLLKDGRAFTSNNSYGGPLDEDFSYEQFIQDLKQVGANRYLIRFAPWLGNHQYFPADKVKYSRQTVARELLHPIKFGHGTRSSATKNIKSGCQYVHASGESTLFNDVVLFHELYNATMERNRSEKCYRYNVDYFDDLFENLSHNSDLFIIDKYGEWIAAAIFVFDDDTAHYLFSGSNIAYSNLYPMERLISEACYYYQRQGKCLIHFGGGLRDGDSLFAFKKKFGNMVLPYYIAEGEV